MQKILSHMRKAIEAYHMIDEKDKIAVCLSGRKRLYHYVTCPKSTAKILSKKI